MHVQEKYKKLRMTKTEPLCSTATEDKAAEQLFVIRCRGLERQTKEFDLNLVE